MTWLEEIENKGIAIGEMNENCISEEDVDKLIKALKLARGTLQKIVFSWKEIDKGGKNWGDFLGRIAEKDLKKLEKGKF